MANTLAVGITSVRDAGGTDLGGSGRRKTD